MNKVILIGRIGKDPELSYTQSGKAMCKFPLATSESYKNNAGERQEKTEWHNIIVWGKTAENISKYFHKGSYLPMEGKLSTKSWEDNDGKKCYITEVTLTFFEFGPKENGSKNNNRTGDNTQSNNNNNRAGNNTQSNNNGNNYQGSMGPDDDDIPF